MLLQQYNPACIFYEYSKHLETESNQSRFHLAFHEVGLGSAQNPHYTTHGQCFYRVVPYSIHGATAAIAASTVLRCLLLVAFFGFVLPFSAS